MLHCGSYVRLFPPASYLPRTEIDFWFFRAISTVQDVAKSAIS